MDVYP
jgi:hypothetical protein